MTENQIGELFDKYSRHLLIVISNRLFEGCPPDYAYDCLDEVFAIALRKSNDEKFNTNPGGWLVQTAKYVVDNFNRKTVNRLQFYQSNYNFNLHKIPATDTLMEDLVYKLALEENVMERILSDLSTKDRVIYIMRYYQNKEPSEIAKELCMNTNAVKVRLTRLKSKIRKLIKKYVGENGTA